MNWKSLIGKVAPVIGTALGGPFGGMAASAAAKALGIDEGETIEDTEMAIQQAMKTNPEWAYKLKKADADFKTRMAELGIKEKELAVRDRGSAREMFTKTGDKTPVIMAYITLALFGAALYFVFMRELPKAQEALIHLLLGGLITRMDQVYNFFFGSSLGSKKKTEIMKGK